MLTSAEFWTSERKRLWLLRSSRFRRARSRDAPEKAPNSNASKDDGERADDEQHRLARRGDLGLDRRGVLVDLVGADDLGLGPS